MDFNILYNLLKIKSTHNRPAELKNIINYVKNIFINNSDFVIKEFDSNGFQSLVVSFEDSKDFDIILNGHLDVVNEADIKQFEPFVDEDKIIGRGASDMKGLVFVLIELMLFFSKKEIKPNLALMLTTDEEIGGYNGVNYLLSNHKYHSKLAIIPDGGNNFNLVNAQKGVCHCQLNFLGETAHGSRPWLGKNAVDLAYQQINYLRKFFPGLDELKDNHWLPTLNLGRIEAGQSINSVPDLCKVFLDIRYTDNFFIKNIIEKINDITENNYEIRINDGVFYVPESNRYLQIYKKIVKQSIGIDIKILKEDGGSDARFFSQYEIPCLISTPDHGLNHSAYEWISKSGLEKYFVILKEFINNFYQTKTT